MGRSVSIDMAPYVRTDIDMSYDRNLCSHVVWRSVNLPDLFSGFNGVKWLDYNDIERWFRDE